MRQVGGCVWIHPANHRICDEGGYQDIEGPLVGRSKNLLVV
jgi:hypothetical protein